MSLSRESNRLSPAIAAETPLANRKPSSAFTTVVGFERTLPSSTSGAAPRWRIRLGEPRVRDGEIRIDRQPLAWLHEGGELQATTTTSSRSMAGAPAAKLAEATSDEAAKTIRRVLLFIFIPV
jgi:hypothetical protein